MAIDIKIDTAQFTKIEQHIRETAKEILGGSDLKKEVGDFAVERVKYQARISKPTNVTGAFPDLKPSTIKNRFYLATYNKVHPTFEDERSNLTITGEFLDSLTWLDKGDTLLQLAFTGMHKPYVGAKGQRISKTIMNETLAKYLAQKGFNVFDMSLQQNKIFISRIKTICLRYIRRGLRIGNRVAEYDGQD
jgi:hypothetical protein